MRAVAFDRTAVLFVGVALGACIGFAFAPKHVSASPPARIASSGHGAPMPAIKVADLREARGADCAVPFQPRLLRAISTGDRITIGVFGDSFGDGVWAALYRRLPKTENFHVVKFSQTATGFTRYDSLNLEEQTAAQLQSQPVDVAVIDFGANDMRGIVQDGHVYQLFSPGWRQVYGQRIDRLVGLLRSKGAVVFWVGLPKMRDAAFDEDIATMNAFYRERMAALGVPFIETRPLSVDDHGEFNAYLPDAPAGELRLMRANDGVHMTMAGYERITAPLVDRITTYVAQSRVAAGVAETMTPVLPGPPPAADHEGRPAASAPS